MSRVLVVKLSSLGDIAQCLPLIETIPNATFDWACEEEFADWLRLHRIRTVHPIPIRAVRRSKSGWGRLLNALKMVRSTEYDAVFDLQGNCKSALITALARARQKVGFGPGSARERPNTWVTHFHVEVDRARPIREQYLKLIQTLFPEAHLPTAPSPRQGPALICPGTTWKNKQLPLHLWETFIPRDRARIYIGGTVEERALCEVLASRCGGEVAPQMSLVQLYQLMKRAGHVYAVDSGLLHLADAAGVPTTSFFGPTHASVFAPKGSAYQGECPYGVVFEKQCPYLRTCPTGACMNHLKQVTGEHVENNCDCESSAHRLSGSGTPL